MVQAARSGKQNIVEEFANCANTLCHMVDKMMSTHMAKMAADFKEKGGIRERMTAAGFPLGR